MASAGNALAAQYSIEGKNRQRMHLLTNAWLLLAWSSNRAAHKCFVLLFMSLLLLCVVQVRSQRYCSTCVTRCQKRQAAATTAAAANSADTAHTAARQLQHPQRLQLQWQQQRLHRQQTGPCVVASAAAVWLVSSF
jgi:hypothetical protein